MKPNDEKCMQCGACCKLFHINLNENEYASGKYQTVFDGVPVSYDFNQVQDCGAHFLAQKADGSCIYLQNDACGIHTERPGVCREYFCSSSDDKYQNMHQIIAKYKLDVKRDREKNAG